MILERGNMWDVFGKTEYFLITTNPIINSKGEVVMGRGIAKEMKNRFTKFPKDFAENLAYKNKHYPDYVTNVGLVGTYDNQVCGYFMVKDHWAENASLDIIRESTRKLIEVVSGFNDIMREPPRFDLNFPGIGNGKLKREDVLPIIEQLPDNVHVWEYGV